MTFVRAIALVLLTIVSLDARAAFTISNNSGAVQTAANSSGTNTLSLTGTVSNDLIVVGCYWRGDTGVTISSVAISGEGAFSSATAVNDTTNGHRMQFWYLPALSGSGAKTVTVTYTGSILGECLGASLSTGSGAALDDSDGATGNSATATVDLQSTAANDAIFAIVTGGPSAPTLGAGYSRVTFNDVWYYAEAEYNLNVGSSGTETVSMTVDNSAWSIHAIAFKISAGVGGSVKVNPVSGRGGAAAQPIVTNQ